MARRKSSSATPATKKSASKGSRPARGRGKRGSTTEPSGADSYQHPEAALATRPDVGTQSGFRKKKPPKSYKYDSSLSPALDWDGQNAARERGEELIATILGADSLDAAKGAAEELMNLSQPFLNWAGKAERLSFDVPTLPLFVHERLSTQVILETLKRHRRDQQTDIFDLFGDPRRSITDQVMRAYEHRDRWVNRLLLGDSMVVMNSLLEYEGLGGQVQMIYIDPPYGVKFGSNFQPFVRKRDVKHNDDADMTREPEMVQAYRDTWELGLHSYLTYLRDRLLLARELLTPSGSVFVQISDENLHHVREVMDEVFGAENFVGVVSFKKTGWQSASELSLVADYLLWYARNKTSIRFRPQFLRKSPLEEGGSIYRWVEEANGQRRRMTDAELDSADALPNGARIFGLSPLTSSGFRTNTSVPFTYRGTTYDPSRSYNWKTSLEGLRKLDSSKRLIPVGRTLWYVRYLNDFPVVPLTNVWTDVAQGFQQTVYVVQTNARVLERCILMTTDPGDLVLDPTCGSGTTAYVAEQWGRRWITIDTSRVPLALARQRILTATYPWYALNDDARGPAGGFVYKRKQNNKGEEVGGIVPHVGTGTV